MRPREARKPKKKNVAFPSRTHTYTHNIIIGRDRQIQTEFLRRAATVGETLTCSSPANGTTSPFFDEFPNSYPPTPQNQIHSSTSTCLLSINSTSSRKHKHFLDHYPLFARARSNIHPLRRSALARSTCIQSVQSWSRWINSRVPSKRTRRTPRRPRPSSHPVLSHSQVALVN